jgi:hypothetical protein
MSAGVARMYTGTAGRIENCQVGVFMAYVTPDGGRALIDRELYLPEKWTSIRDRCQRAGIGDGVAFATKPELARKMIERTRDAGIPFSWVTADEAYGGNPGLRTWLEEQGIPYVMAVSCDAVISTAAGSKRADELAALVPDQGWQRLSCADGSKGPRLDDWALIGTTSPDCHLLVRRPLVPNEKGDLELAFFRCWSPPPRHPPRSRGRGGRAVGRGRMLCRGQERGRPGPLPGPQVPRLVPARHLVHARPRLPRRHRPGIPARCPAGHRRRDR